MNWIKIMLRTLTLAAILASTLVQPAFAVDESRYVRGFPGVACEDDQTKRDMEEVWKTLKWDRRPPLGKNIKVIRAKTTGKSETGMVCEVTVRAGSKRMRGEFRLNLYSGGRWGLGVKIYN